MAAPAQTRKLAFVTYTGPPFEQARESLPAVRNHVVFDYLQCERIANGWTPPPSPASKRPIPRKGKRGRGAACEPESSRVLEGRRDTQSHHNEIALPASTRRQFHNANLQTSQRTRLEWMDAIPGVANLDAHRLDPFDSLPVRGCVPVDNLVRWWFKGFSNKEPGAVQCKSPPTHVLVRIWMDSLWNVSLSDAAVFHLQLCMSASRRAVVLGRAPGSEYFDHKGRAIQIIREKLKGKTPCYKDTFGRLNGPEDFPIQSQIPCNELKTFLMYVVDSPEDMNDSSIVSITLMVYMSVMEGAPGSGNIHTRALQRIIASRGGLSTLADAAWLVIVSSDLSDAAAQLREPALPYCPRAARATAPTDLQQVARGLTSITMRKFPVSMRNQGLHYIWDGLHQLGLASDQGLNGKLDPFAYEVVYRIRYQLCLLISNVRGEYPIEATAAAVKPVVDALYLTAQAFLWTAIHEAAFLSRVQMAFLSQHHTTLHHTADSIELWEREASLEALLWVLFIGSVFVFLQRSERAAQSVPSWLLNAMRVVIFKLNLVDVVDFERVLRMFPWTDRFCTDYCKFIWDTL